MAKRKVFVQTPRGKIVQVRRKDGTLSARIVWGEGFAAKRSREFQTVQDYIDSECIRLMAKYTPMRSGVLRKSATLGTTIGTGAIYQVAPYARYQYYGKLMVSRLTGSPWARHGESKVLTDRDLQYSKHQNPHAQRLWFEVMKANHGQQILRGAAAFTKRRF